ncbi:MAG: glycerol-3-phosphate acyltransferase [Desulfobacterales bacterium]|nr:glycerol-3-phosphate acyltransferase [Desulfobacterales bacterium]
MLLLAYVAGSINFAIIVLGLLGKEDPRTKFSGNAGTTNVYRQAGSGMGGRGPASSMPDGPSGWRRWPCGPCPPPWFPWVGTALVRGEPLSLFSWLFRAARGSPPFWDSRFPLPPGVCLPPASSGSPSTASCGFPSSPPSAMVLTLGGATVWAGEPRAAAVAGTAVDGPVRFFFNHRKNMRHTSLAREAEGRT